MLASATPVYDVLAVLAVNYDHQITPIYWDTRNNITRNNKDMRSDSTVTIIQTQRMQL